MVRKPEGTVKSRKPAHVSPQATCVLDTATDDDPRPVWLQHHHHRDQPTGAQPGAASGVEASAGSGGGSKQRGVGGGAEAQSLLAMPIGSIGGGGSAERDAAAEHHAHQAALHKGGKPCWVTVLPWLIDCASLCLSHKHAVQTDRCLGFTRAPLEHMQSHALAA